MNRIINTIPHDLTIKQVVYEMLRCFEESKTEPVFIVLPIGKGEGYPNLIRAHLARERSKKTNPDKTVFGIRTTGPIPACPIPQYGDAEVIAVRFNLTKSQLMLNIFSEVESA